MNYGIIAAGEGSRLVQEGVKLPKPLVSLNGEPMIKRLIDIFMANEAESLSIIVNEQMTEVREYLEGLELPVELRLTVKTTPSSMHSFGEIVKTLPEEGKFIVTTVDTIFRAEEFGGYVRAFAESNDADGYMAVTGFIDDEKPLYVETDEDMRITSFNDKSTPGVKYISGGIYGLTNPQARRIVEQCLREGQSRMRNYQRALIEDGMRLKAYEFGKIVDVDHASDIAVALETIK